MNSGAADNGGACDGGTDNGGNDNGGRDTPGLIVPPPVNYLAFLLIGFPGPKRTVHGYVAFYRS